MHPNGYTQDMIKEILGTAWLDKDNIPETGNQIRRRKGQEMREGKRPYPKYPSKAVSYTHQTLPTILRV